MSFRPPSWIVSEDLLQLRERAFAHRPPNPTSCEDVKLMHRLPAIGTKAAYSTARQEATINLVIGREAPMAHYATNARIHENAS